MNASANLIIRQAQDSKCTMVRASILLSSRVCLRRIPLGSASFLHARRAQFVHILDQPSQFLLQTPRANHFYSTMVSDLSSSLKFPDTGFDIVDASEPIEEETLPNYSSANYYPAHIGQVLLDRYQIVGKLGYGVTSTVWLGRDLLCVSPSATLNLLIQLTGLGFL